MSLGGRRDPDPPVAGDRFRVRGVGVLAVTELVATFTDDGAPPRFLVTADDGARWLLVARDPVLDGIPFSGTPAP